MVVLLIVGSAYDLWRVHVAGPLPPAPVTVSAATRPAADTTRGARSAPAATTDPAAGSGSKPLDLNRASAQELDALPGIGPVLAARIVEARERQGGFRRMEDLAAVRGIGPRAIERLRGRVIVQVP